MERWALPVKDVTDSGGHFMAAFEKKVYVHTKRWLKRFDVG